MKKEFVSDRQCIILIFLFLVGESAIFVRGGKAEQDLWIAVLVALIMTFPMAMIYARLHCYIFMGKDIFDLIEFCFGKLVGKIIILLFAFYTFELSSAVTINASQFIITTSFPETPEIMITIMLIILSAWILRSGLEVFSRWGGLFGLIAFTVLIGSILLLIPDTNIDNIFPILNNGVNPIIKGAFGAFAYAFAEIIIFIMVFSKFESKKSPYKVYFLGLLIGGILVFMISFMNILVLGSNTAGSFYFATHSSFRRIDAGKYFQRIEVLIATVFMIGVFVKISITYLATCKCIAKVFGFKDYKFIIIPIGLLLINLSVFLHENIFEYFEFGEEVYPYYAFPFQVILPIIILITAKMKMRKVK
ncbi:MAG: endospore germination permease [Maledivibacter sp.]|nr:endospore germination permease [Maledivibacter sp.]